MEFKHKQLGFILYGLEPASELEDFALPPEIEQQHALIAAYFGLYRAQTTLSQCEYYFRRFPFHGLPVSRDDHLRNVCELYFGSFYTIRSRIKLTLNSLKEVCPNANVDVGGVLRIFDKEFDTELRTRNKINHHGPFEDFGIERISIFGVIGSDKDLISQSWARQHVRGIAFLLGNGANEPGAKRPLCRGSSRPLRVRYSSTHPSWNSHELGGVGGKAGRIPSPSSSIGLPRPAVATVSPQLTPRAWISEPRPGCCGPPLPPLPPSECSSASAN
jgi:hypothetical protein